MCCNKVLTDERYFEIIQEAASVSCCVMNDISRSFQEAVFCFVLCNERHFEIIPGSCVLFRAVWRTISRSLQEAAVCFVLCEGLSRDHPRKLHSVSCSVMNYISRSFQGAAFCVVLYWYRHVARGEKRLLGTPFLVEWCLLSAVIVTDSYCYSKSCKPTKGAKFGVSLWCCWDLWLGQLRSPLVLCCRNAAVVNNWYWIVMCSDLADGTDGEIVFSSFFFFWL